MPLVPSYTHARGSLLLQLKQRTGNLLTSLLGLTDAGSFLQPHSVIHPSNCDDHPHPTPQPHPINNHRRFSHPEQHPFDIKELRIGEPLPDTCQPASFTSGTVRAADLSSNNKRWLCRALSLSPCPPPSFAQRLEKRACYHLNPIVSIKRSI